MGGGLFGTPLYLNPKCLIFSTFVLAVYFLPHPKSTSYNLIMSFLLATSAYIIMAWYDVIYDCNDKFGPTFFGWMTKPFKPPSYQDKYKELPIKYQKTIRAFDIAVIAIILFTMLFPFIFKKK
jgi:hypothetical protein